MAKKVVATLQSKNKASVTKVIVPVLNQKTGAYSFKEEIVPQEKIKDFIAKHKS